MKLSGKWKYPMSYVNLPRVVSFHEKYLLLKKKQMKCNVTLLIWGNFNAVLAANIWFYEFFVYSGYVIFSYSLSELSLIYEYPPMDVQIGETCWIKNSLVLIDVDVLMDPKLVLLVNLSLPLFHGSLNYFRMYLKGGCG